MTTMKKERIQKQIKEEEAIKHFRYKDDPISFIRDHRYGFNNNSFKFEILPLFDFEIAIIKFIHENKSTILKKSRQMHMSTLVASYCAWKMLFSEDFAIGIIGHNMESSNRFIEHVRIILQYYSNDLFHWEDDFVKNNKSEIRLSNGCGIKAFAANSSAALGYSMNMYVFDEAALMNLEIIIKNILPVTTARKNSKLIMYSTPNYTNYFYKFWCEAINGKNEFITKHIDWTMNPLYTKNSEMRNGKLWSPWYEDLCKMLNYDESAIQRELWGEFSQNVKPTSMRVNFRIDTDLHEEMTNKIGDRSVSDYLRDLIKRDLQV